MIRAYSELQLDRSGSFGVPQVKTMLEKLNVPADDATASAMLRSMRGGKRKLPQPPGGIGGAATGAQSGAASGAASATGSGAAGARKGVGFMRGHLPSSESATLNYGEFRNFLCLLPPERLHVDPNRAWFEASTIVSVGKPPVAEGMALKSAIAGASAAGLSTICLHPIDTLKCLVQVSPKGESMVAIAKRILSRGAPTGSWKQLYRGMWPAFFGSSAMHGLRTGGYEVARFTLERAFPGLGSAAIATAAAGMGTLTGTTVRIPCEVVKQRLQSGTNANVKEAVKSATAVYGVRGLWSGTTFTLLREVPLYMFGSVFYEQGKKLYTTAAGRESLANWELIAIGALSGSVGAALTTPADLIKTRIMTNTTGVPIRVLALVREIVRTNGPLGLFKGALPRALWIAPVGAVNFGAYEIARSALIDKDNN